MLDDDWRRGGSGGVTVRGLVNGISLVGLTIDTGGLVGVVAEFAKVLGVFALEAETVVLWTGWTWEGSLLWLSREKTRPFQILRGTWTAAVYLRFPIFINLCLSSM